MTALAFFSTPFLRRVADALARLGIGLGMRVAIANEIWAREELEHAVASARQYWHQNSYDHDHRS